VLKHLSEIVKEFKDTPYLGGMTSVALAAGVAKSVLDGKYLDAQQDLGDILAQEDLVCKDPHLYALHTSFLGDLPNDGGTENLSAETPQAFPGV